MGPLTSYKRFEFDYAKPFLMSGEMEEISRHFLKVENGIEKLSDKLEMMEEEQEKMIIKAQFMDDTLKTVKDALAGNVNVGMKGMAERVADLEQKQKEYDKIYYKVIGAGIILSIVWPILSKIVNSLIDKM